MFIHYLFHAYYHSSPVNVTVHHQLRDTMDAPTPPTPAQLEVSHVETLFHIPHQVINK